MGMTLDAPAPSGTNGASSRPRGTASTISATDVLAENMAYETEIVPIDDGPPRTSAPKESWAECHPLCRKCPNKSMSRDGKGWKCKCCGNTDTNGKWCVEYYPAIPTLNKRQRPRLNQLTLETWNNRKAAEKRVEDLLIHFRAIKTLPEQPTSQSPDQCRAAETLFRKLKCSSPRFSVVLGG